MEKIDFTYVVEPGSYHGSVTLYEGACKYKSNKLCYFTKENDLVNFLKENPENAVAIFTIDDSSEALAEGERLSEKLNLQFIHP